MRSFFIARLLSVSLRKHRILSVIPILLIMMTVLLPSIPALSQSPAEADLIPNPYSDAMSSAQAVERASAINIGKIDKGVNAILTGEYAPNVFDAARNISKSPVMTTLARQAAEQNEGMAMQQAANNILNSSLGEVNQIYRGLHQWTKDDIVGNLFNNIGQLGGKWLTELTAGWIADTTQFLSKALRIFVLNPNVATDGLDNPFSFGFSKQIRAAADLMYGIAVDLLLLLFILSIWKFWADASWQGAGNLMAPVGRLIFTAGLLLGWPTIYAFEIQISNEMIKAISASTPQEIMMLDYTIAEALRLGVTAFWAGTVSIFAPVLAKLGLGAGLGSIVGGTFSFAGTLVFTILGGILIAQLVYILVLKAIQTALLIAQYVFAPVFLVFLAIPDTESYATGYVKALVETSLWTFIWVGLLKILSILLFTYTDPLGKALIAIGVLQLMIQVPTFLGRAQISPVSDFITPGLAFGTIQKAFAGVGNMTSSLVTQGFDWFSKDSFADTGLSTSKQVALNGLASNSSSPQMTHSLNNARPNSSWERNTPPVANKVSHRPAQNQRQPASNGYGNKHNGDENAPKLILPNGTDSKLRAPGAALRSQENTTAVQSSETKSAAINNISVPIHTEQSRTQRSKTSTGEEFYPETQSTPLVPKPNNIAESLSSEEGANPLEAPKSMTQDEIRFKFPAFSLQTPTAASWNEPNLKHVDTRKLIARITAADGVGLTTDATTTSITGSTSNGVKKINVAAGASNSELTQLMYTAAFANNLSTSDAAADAARSAVVKAKGNQPSGLIENLCANWMSNSGTNWNTTSIAKQRFQQEMFQQAVDGSRAYICGEKGNPYTDYLRERFGEWTMADANDAEHLIANPESSESPWNRQIGPATDSLVSSGIPIRIDTRAAMQNAAVTAMHPVRRKQAVFALLTYTYPQARMLHPELEDDHFQSAHGEMSRNLNSHEAEQVMKVYEMSGQSDLSCALAPNFIAHAAELAYETNSDFASSYETLKSASMNTAQEEGYLSQNHQTDLQSYTDLFDAINGSEREKASAMSHIIQTARTKVQTQQSHRTQMTHVHNFNYAKSDFKGIS